MVRDSWADDDDVMPTQKSAHDISKIGGEKKNQCQTAATQNRVPMCALDRMPGCLCVVQSGISEDRTHTNTAVGILISLNYYLFSFIFIFLSDTYFRIKNLHSSASEQQQRPTALFA